APQANSFYVGAKAGD
nr:RecName: Full=Outer membrane protein P5; Short=OMP P5; AltName: Full=Outer membrane protein A [Glaesserella parasuis]